MTSMISQQAVLKMTESLTFTASKNPRVAIDE